MALVKLVDRQSRTMQRAVIEAATADGTIGTLYWYVEMRVPPRLAAIYGTSALPACAPAGVVPVLPVGRDPWAAYEYADLLRGVFAHSNRGHGVEFIIALTAADLLVKIPHYTWGERPPQHSDRDQVCQRCGGVGDCACPTPEALVTTDDGVALWGAQGGGGACKPIRAYVMLDRAMRRLWALSGAQLSTTDSCA